MRSVYEERPAEQRPSPSPHVEWPRAFRKAEQERANLKRDRWLAAMRLEMWRARDFKRRWSDAYIMRRIKVLSDKWGLTPFLKARFRY